MTIWVRRAGETPPTPLWHLIEEMAPTAVTGVTLGACGAPFEDQASLLRLDAANPADNERCPACQAAYRSELRAS
jgi:hypothetical protein